VNSESDASVVFRHVAKRFGDGPAVLDDVSLTVRAGEFISLIGPSGCGKSTILRLIAGLSAVSSGTLTVNGHSPQHGATELGFVFQEATLLPWLTVTDNVALPLRLRGSPAQVRADAAASTLALVGLTGQGRHYPHQLSGGQKMRVSLARAFTLRPKILLLDEPFGALDEMTRQRLNEELLAIRAQQEWTGIFVTHSVAEAVFLSHRVVVMSAHPGRIADEIPVPLAWPRTAETRLTPAYLELVAAISRRLHAADGPLNPSR
jgi:NitT/TauT family transport system ATP-binding protein